MSSPGHEPLNTCLIPAVGEKTCLRIRVRPVPRQPTSYKDELDGISPVTVAFEPEMGRVKPPELEGGLKWREWIEGLGNL